MKCIFFGSPDFAVASLDALLQSSHQVLGIVTQPDRPAGRGLALEPPAVKKRALALGLPILQPEKVNCEETYEFIARLNPDILCVIAYGGFLGERLLKSCCFPPVNVHPSRLPDLRGAAPLQWSVIKGYAETGVSTQFMVKKMDAGDILLQTREMIGPDESTQELHDRLKHVGGQLLVDTLTGLENGTITPKPQDESKVTLAPLLTKEMGRIRWHQESSEVIFNKIRGLTPWPGAFTSFEKKRIKILKAKRCNLSLPDTTPGTIIFRENRLFATGNPGVIELLELQPEGKRPLLPQAFANGMNLEKPVQLDLE